MHVPNISYNRSTSGALQRAQTPRRHEGSTCKDNSFSVTRFSISNPPSENPAYGPVHERQTLTRFNKIATQGAPQMAVDKEANSLSRVYSYYSKFYLRLFYV